MDTSNRVNEFGQPIGIPLDDWRAPPVPPREPFIGRWCRLEPLDPDRHGEDLWKALRGEPDDRIWTYLPYGPFSDPAAYRSWLTQASQGTDPLFFAIRPFRGGPFAGGPGADGRASGLASYLRIAPASGSIEVGHIYYGPALRRRVAATEAMFLMMQRAFELGYRRYEWKCDALNGPSRDAAQRLGFTYEGTFRQASVYKGRNRDTAWYAIVDSDWPALERAFQRWLEPSNFDERGDQRTRLADGLGSAR